MDCIDEMDFDEFGPPRKLVQASIDPSHLEGNLDSFNSFKQNSQISEAALQQISLSTKKKKKAMSHLAQESLTYALPPDDVVEVPKVSISLS